MQNIAILQALIIQIGRAGCIFQALMRTYPMDEEEQ